MSLSKNITKNITFRNNISLILALITFLIIGIILIRYYQYQINPDGLVYMKIAKLYLSGDYNAAISAYWGPLISWLLIPFFIINSNPLYILLSTKILFLIVGFFTIIGINKLSYTFEMEENIRSVIIFASVPIILYFVFSVITPDLLMVCILVFYLSIIFDSEYSNKISNGLFCGVLGSLAYLTKSYSFLFFIAHFFMFNLLHYFKNIQNRRNILKNLFLGFAVFLIVSGIWIGLISQKEGEITYGTAGKFNYYLVSPESKGFGLPHYLGEIKYDGSLTPIADTKQWSPFESRSNFKYQLDIIYLNIIKAFNIMKLFSYFSLIILITYSLFLLKPFKEISTDYRLYPILTITIFILGYILILIEERYLWIIYILLLLMGGYLLNTLFKYDFFTNNKKILVCVVFILSFIWMPVSFLNENINLNKDIYDISNNIETQCNIKGNIATNYGESRVSMAYLSYYLETNYLGQTKKDISDSKLQDQLRKYDIDFYFVWGNNTPSFFNEYTEVTNGKINGLKIYSIKDKVT